MAHVVGFGVAVSIVTIGHWVLRVAHCHGCLVIFVVARF